jgi:hypothetical protein
LRRGQCDPARRIGGWPRKLPLLKPLVTHSRMQPFPSLASIISS